MIKCGKEKGESTIIASIFVILSFCVLFMIFMYYDGGVSHNTQVNSIARKYLMKMETNGYLTPSEQAKLVAELENLPYVDSVEIQSDTSDSFVGHSNDIILHFTCRMKDIPFQSFDIFNPMMDHEQIRLYEVRISSSYI